MDENLNQDRDHDALQVAWHSAEIVEVQFLRLKEASSKSFYFACSTAPQ